MSELTKMPDAELRERAKIVLYFKEEWTWPDGEIPTWVRERHHDTRMAIRLAVEDVQDEVLRRFCE